MRRLTPSDVAAHLGISRSLADLRFRELSGRTIGETIAGVRIGAVKRRLMSSHETIATVARTCGFLGASSLVRYFKRETGQTPDEWRRGDTTGDATKDRV